MTASVKFQRLFWPVTLLSGLSALLTLIALLLIYGQREQWQYLALSGVVAIIILAHGVAWWLARFRRRFNWGIWLVASAQIVSAVLAPLFMADYWLIGLFLLVTVPLEVGLADQLRRIPPFAVATLLGAAGMLTVDLLAPFARLAVFTDLARAIFLVASLLVLHLAGLIVLLWYFRLRPGARQRIRLDLATQQTFVFTAISAVSIVVVTGVLIAQIWASQIEQVGQNFQTLAKINAERVGNSLEQQIDTLLALGRRETILQEALTAANSSYPASKAEARRFLLAQEQRWQTAPETGEFVLRYRSNPQTIELSKFRGADLLHNDVFLTDRLGGLVAAQGEKPAKFFYGDEGWWQMAWNNGQGGVYLGQLTLDSETKIASVFIAAGVLNPQTNQTLGVLASTYQLKAIQRDINRSETQLSGEITLLTSDGLVIAGLNEQLIGQPVWANLLEEGILAPAGNRQPYVESGWFLGADYQGIPAVLAYAPLNTTSGVKLDLLRALDWLVIVNDTQANALAEVTRSTKVASLVGVLVLALVVLAAMAMARLLSRPIEALTRAAAAIREGNLEQKAKPAGPVEPVTLAEAFNSLTTRLRLLINNLQEQVEQRTAELAEATREAQAARIAAEAANEAKSVFLASVSHELRTPLTSVLGYAKVVEKQLQSRIFPKVQVEDRRTRRAIEDISEDLHIIVTEGERLTALINDVLDLAKIEAGKVAWHLEPVAVSTVIERATAATAPLLAGKKELKLIKDVAEELPEIVGDRDRLIQVVINLISNAVKFTDEGSITCQARQLNGNIVVRVIDTGVGIAEAEQTKVFERFVQAGDTLTDKPKGTGLGLPICREIVEYHGGQIWLESKPGQGSVFSFTLPGKAKEDNRRGA